MKQQHSSRLKVSFIITFLFYIIFLDVKRLEAASNGTLQVTKHDQRPVNHRMDPEDADRYTTNKTGNWQHNFYENSNRAAASASVLRPQLALQIFTSPQQAAQPVGQPDVGPALETSGAFLSRAAPGKSNLYQNGAKVGTMIMMPAQAHESVATNNLETRNLMSFEQYGGERESSSSRGKFLPWHFQADQQQPFGLVERSSEASSSGSQPVERGHSPLINAIISIPSTSGGGSEHRYHRHDEERNNNNHNVEQHPASNRKQTTGPLEAEPTQQLGHNNIELSMNLNGDEIVITNPASRNYRSKNSTTQAPLENSARIQTARRNVSGSANIELLNNVSRALRRHVDSDLMEADEQSASEIDLVDGMGQSGDEIESDLDDEVTRTLTRDKDHEDRVKHLNEADRVARKESFDSEPNQFDRETQLNEESRLSNNHHRTATSYRDDDDDDSIGGYKRKHFNNSKQPTNRKQANHAREVAGSKRRATYNKSDDGYSSGSSKFVKSSEPGGERSVMIKGEDVRRFEQLLENLRSLSMNNLEPKSTGGPSKSLRGNKLSRQTGNSKQSIGNSSSKNNSEQPGEGDEGDSGTSNQSSNSRPWNEPDKDGNARESYDKNSRHGGRLSQSGSLSSTVYGGSGERNDCDKSRTRSQSSRSQVDDTLDSDSSGERDSASSPNIVDQDPITSNDGDDLSGDDTNQNVEQEESSSSDNHNKVVSSHDSAQQTSRSRQEALKDHQNNNQIDSTRAEKPNTLLIRKTILQDYYDNNLRHANGDSSQLRGDGDDQDLEQVHRKQHNAHHERISNPNSGPASLVKQIFQLTGGQLVDQQRRLVPLRYAPDNGGAVSKDDSPINNYIDYNQLDDREVYRGSESQKFKVTVPSRQQLERMRSLQYMIERAAIDEGKSFKSKARE